MNMETILVLNADYTPLNLTTFRRALKLIMKGKAEIVKNEEEEVVRSEKLAYPKPLIIRLLNYIKSKKYPLIDGYPLRLYKKKDCCYRLSESSQYTTILSNDYKKTNLI